jgi:D-methionine transport system substrate-binding protein
MARGYYAPTGLEANNAVFRGDIYANVMQHTVFLDSYNERQKADLVGIVHVPTPPMGLYSKNHALGTPIRPGSTMAVSNDPVNLQRALWILRDLGLIDAYKSPTCKSVILSNRFYNGFTLPDYLR